MENERDKLLLVEVLFEHIRFSLSNKVEIVSTFFKPANRSTMSLQHKNFVPRHISLFWFWEQAYPGCRISIVSLFYRTLPYRIYELVHGHLIIYRCKIKPGNEHGAHFAPEKSCFSSVLCAIDSRLKFNHYCWIASKYIAFMWYRISHFKPLHSARHNNVHTAMCSTTIMTNTEQIRQDLQEILKHIFCFRISRKSWRIVSLII